MGTSIQEEWLEADGLGGYASGTASTIRTRRYHALLLTATTPPTGRMALVNGVEAWIETAGHRFALSSHRYAPDVTYPDGVTHLASFTAEPWPSWTWTIPSEPPITIQHELLVVKGSPAVVLTWRMLEGNGSVTLTVRPLLSGRRDHALHHENRAFRFASREQDGAVLWSPYDGVPAIAAHSNGAFTGGPEWYRNFLYQEERNRGLDDTEDLASPGTFRWQLDRAAVLIFRTLVGQTGSIVPDEGTPHESGSILPVGASTDPPAPAASSEEALETVVERLKKVEHRRRQRLGSRLNQAADAYLVKRGTDTTIIAGYPWFTDWGRDTFIAMRGLCLARDRLKEALSIALAWADSVSEGMVPNRFPDEGEAPEYNSVDASLWYVIAVVETLEAIESAGRRIPAGQLARLQRAVESILDGYSAGTRFGIHADADGLLYAGVDGSSVTWMDARVNGHAITPRIGKPAEVQALWINALQAGSRFSGRWAATRKAALASFGERFWNESRGCLYDVVDVDHAAGTVDPAIRPNQVFAVGGLPLALLKGPKASSIVDVIEEQLLTPAGLRSLSPSEPGYCPRYEGGPSERDGAYHQGTVWPWLMGAFVDAWLRIRRNSKAARKEARARFLEPLLDRLDLAGIGHVSEIADAESPHPPRGCPFQAWSVGETIRIERMLRE